MIVSLSYSDSLYDMKFDSMEDFIDWLSFAVISHPVTVYWVEN